MFNNVELQNLVQDAESGDQYSQFELGLVYLHGDILDGKPIPQNYEQAFKWLNLALCDAYEEVIIPRLGLMYLFNKGIPEVQHKGVLLESDDAFAWFCHQIPINSAVVVLGHIYFSSQGRHIYKTDSYAALMIAEEYGEEGNEYLLQLKDEIGALLSEDERVEARRVAHEWEDLRRAIENERNRVQADGVF